MATAVLTDSGERETYLNVAHGPKSWLLTVDHKRIALLYLLSITFFFFIGGIFALFIRLNLLTPSGDLMQADTYNKLFTMHGQVMVFFFVIPGVPAVLGNFLIPMMIGAKDLAFPRINLLSWYLFILGGVLMIYTILNGGVDTGWTFYTPLSTEFLKTNVISAALAVFVAGFSSIHIRINGQMMLVAQAAQSPRSLTQVEHRTGVFVQAEHSVLHHGEAPHQHEFLVHHTNAKRDGVFRAVDCDRLAVDQDRSGIHGMESVENLHQGAFAGAVFSQ